jgi:GST-like protein
MIDLHYWTTPNGHKIAIFLEEAELSYRIVPINLARDEQFGEAFLRISPNGKIPAIVDQAPKDGGAPVALFESGSILTYLAEKTERFLPSDERGRFDVMQWLFWQVGGLGPMAGQLNFFRRAAQEKTPFAIERYAKETARLFGVLNRRLADCAFLAGDAYSIADMAAYPWTAPYDLLQQNIDDYPNVRRWLDVVGARPAVRKAYAIAKELNPNAPQPPTPDDRAKAAEDR